jgi:CRISPR-associated endonuclease/helicase Cas3
VFGKIFVSVALARAQPGWLASAHDPELVLHLVASHHGHARPFAPAEPVTHPVPVECTVGGVTAIGSTGHGMARLDSGVPARFWRCVRRYGPYGLAWLEAILRLADHRASEAVDPR